MFKYLVSRQWNYVGRTGRCGLIGEGQWDVLLGDGKGEL